VEVKIGWWIGFNIFVIAMIIIDLVVFHRKDKEIKVREALIWSAFWIILSLLFNVGVYFWFGSEKALEFFTGYLIEKSLSVDNLFVFFMIFSYFKVPAKYQYRVLFYGILVAMVLRAAFILVGVRLINEFYWLLYVLGGFLVIIAFKMFFEKDKEYDPGKNLVVRIFSKFMPMKMEYKNHNFIIKENGKHHITQLFVVLMVINFVDLVFAIDSIPAIFAITLDPFIVYTSNMFAILGLRALYFALAGIIKKFYYLKYGLAIILGFVGIKMLVMDFYHISTLASLGFIALVLAIAIILSGIRARKIEG